MLQGEWNSPESVGACDYHAQHCDSCFNVRQCLKSQQSALRNQLKRDGGQVAADARCLIISCPQKCPFQFHACKQGEHEQVCENMVVPCINAHYGCPFRIRRRNGGTHLSRCPASVVVCTVEWNRKPLFPGSTRPFEHDPSHLDVASLNCDKATLREFKSSLPLSLRRVLKTPTNKHPIMPLGVAGRRIPASIMAQAHAEGANEVPSADADELDEEEEEDEDCGSHESVEGKASMASPPGLQLSLCAQLKRPSHLKTWKENGVKGVDVENGKTAEPELSLLIDFITKHSGRHLKWYSFMCAREFRRDEFSDHFRNVHSEIGTQLNGWLFKRCPMASFGCPFGIPHMFPLMDSPNAPTSYKVQYSEGLETFCFTQDVPTSGDAEDVAPFLSLRLHELPFEVLMHLTKYLDPLSLNSLSMTHGRLRRVCASVVSLRGIVVLDWERSPATGKWSLGGKKWMFSTAFSPIRKWGFGEVGLLSNHLKACAYYNAQKYLPKEPFAYAMVDASLL